MNVNYSFSPTRLLECRKELGLSQQDVADAAGISSTTYCLLENGRKEPMVSTLVRVARALSKPPGYFFAGQLVGPKKAA